jgi:phosphatidylserine/phosphatidylglycerophosphate/cardiolipin synthase-like enzyme
VVEKAMTPQEVERMLRQTLADSRLSGGERTALSESLAGLGADGQQAAACRHQAFALAKEAVADPQARAVLDWLEDVVKVLHPVRAGQTAQAASEALFAPEDNLAGRVCRLFDAARWAVEVCVFTITDDRITEAILRAHRRGVVIRLITDNDKALDLGSDIHRLADAGVPVLVDRTEAHMHHKFALFDRSVLLNGSYNWTRGAGERNHENLVLTREKELVDAFSRHFVRLWQRLGGKAERT